MHTPLPAVLPDRLTDYLPGRITLVSPDLWPATLAGRYTRAGIPTTIPRYALELRSGKDTIDPQRVRWLAEGSATRLLSTRHVHVTTHRGALWIIDGHTALAAHLAVGTEQIPVRLVTLETQTSSEGELAGAPA